MVSFPTAIEPIFLGRSQPPFFALMVQLLAEEKGASIFQKYLPALEKEYAFWMHTHEESNDHAWHRVVEYESGKMLNRYFDNIGRPRTEMYSDDVELIKKDGDRARQMILDIRAACESGWDFSSRWFHVPDEMETIHTTDILPIDLNCLLYSLENTLARAYNSLKNSEKAYYFQLHADTRRKQMAKLFWNERDPLFP